MTVDEAKDYAIAKVEWMPWMLENYLRALWSALAWDVLKVGVVPFSMTQDFVGKQVNAVVSASAVISSCTVREHGWIKETRALVMQFVETVQQRKFQATMKESVIDWKDGSMRVVAFHVVVTVLKL